MDLQLAQRVAVVTGGASNIGRAVALALATERANVLIADLDRAGGERVVEQARWLGANDTALVVADLTDEGAADAVVAEAVQRWGDIDVLVNNAGFTKPDFFSRQRDPAAWRRSLDVNLVTAMACTQAVLQVMVPQRRGSIVFMSSDAAFGEARNAVYGAAKAGMIAFAKAIAIEHGRDGIRANVVAPGLVPPAADATGANSFWREGADSMFSADQMEQIVRRIPLRRLTTAQDVADAVLFLASERMARQVTGQVIAVNGGFVMP